MRAQPDHFVVRVQDKDTGEPLGCVRLTTTGDIVYTSDDNGVAAIYEPGLMGQSVFFTPEREGYFYPADFLGIAGKAFDLVAGGSGTLEMTRDGDPGVCAAGLEGTLLASEPVPPAPSRFRIEVRERGSGRPVPLVSVRSPRREHTTDSSGLIAFYDPGLMGREVFFEVDAHGYRFVDDDGDGGAWLTPTAGETAVLEVVPRRDQIARRLYRVTGGGIYRDTLLLGQQAPTARPLVNGLVMGQDTVFSTLYRGRPFYIWGDTNKPSYPLGNFKVSGATSRLPQQGGLDPRLGVDLEYFTDATGFTKELAPEETVPNPPGEDDFLATWLGGLVTAPGPDGEERLFASYGMFELLFAREKGLVRWNDEDQLFHKILVIPDDAPLIPHGPAQVVHHGDGGDYVYYHNGVRVPRTEAALRDLDRYEGFTPFLQGSLELDRDAEGGLRYAWRPATRALVQEMLDRGLDVAPEEALFGHVTELGGDRRPLVHENGSTAWNDYRGRYVRTILENFGDTSFLGEIWFAEADTPMGPWVYARKVVTHDGYSFYNPMHHPFFDQRGGREIFFEGTYTTLFSGEEPTARYDYNQIMYSLDLTDPRLRLPVPIYHLGGGELAGKEGVRRGTDPGAALFMAWDRPHPEGVPVHWSGAACEADRVLQAGGRPATPPIFHAAREDAAVAAGGVPLLELADARDGGRRYGPAGAYGSELRTVGAPLGVVWPNPIEVALPVADYLADLVADAGVDQCVTEVAPGAGAVVVLDASRSDSLSGEIVDFRWSRWPDGRLAASGPAPELELGVGLWTFVLEVTDDAGASSTDAVTVRVEPAGSGG